MKKDIQTQRQINELVDSFYSKVREDDMLGPIFNKTIQDKWPVHLDKMYRFWGTVLLGEFSYRGQPFLAHLKLPLSLEHFQRWLNLFNETLNRFEGPKTEEARSRAAAMASMFQHKLDFYKTNPDKIPLQ